MFGPFGAQEIFLILVIALIVFGPRKLPDIGKSMGRMLAEFRKASNEFKRTLEDEVESEKARENAVATTPSSEAAPVTPSPYSDGTIDPAPADAWPAATETPAGAEDRPVEGHEAQEGAAAAVTAEGQPGTISREDSRPIEPR